MDEKEQMGLFQRGASQKVPVTKEALVASIQRYNAAYRAGKPLIGDGEYDRLVERLRALEPEHAFLNAVEPELLADRAAVRHPTPMLSTQKAYTTKELESWVQRMEKVALELGVSSPQYRITPKLDGLAGRDERGVFSTRGNGRVGANISFAWERGIVPIGGRGLGVGEIVISKSYFDTHLAESFEHPRNLCVGIVSADVVNEEAKIALEAGAVHFVPYVGLVSWQGSGQEMMEQLEQITGDLKAKVDYALDGLVAEVVDQNMRARLGATNHHNRWQIAIKEQGESAHATVLEVIWQTGRTGNITPVLVISPVKLSGASISRITAHHAGMVKSRGLGTGAEIEIVRSGEVIPKLVGVHTPSDNVELPERCPSCDNELVWREDFLRCLDAVGCPGQVVHRIRHFFWVLGNSDGMGIKTVERVVAAGHTRLSKVYALTMDDFLQMGFGPGQSKVLVRALEQSRLQPVEDARFLAALGVPDLGIGESRRLLGHLPLSSLSELDAERLEAIKGFGPITSKRISEGLQALWEEVEHLLGLGFALEITPVEAERLDVESPISGKKIVFTGSMSLGTRDEMKKEARRLGADVLSSVSKKTDLVVFGEKAGSKLQKARELGVEVLSESDYRNLLLK